MKRRNLARFLNRAEQSWLNVVDSAWPYRGNVKEKTMLPDRFRTKGKLFRYFHQFWSRDITKDMMCNLRLKQVKGRLYIPQGDPPPVAVRPVRIFISQRTSNSMVIHASLYGNPSGKQLIRYGLRKNCTGKWRIVSRTKRHTDLRYKRCCRKG